MKIKYDMMTVGIFSISLIPITDTTTSADTNANPIIYFLLSSTAKLLIQIITPLFGGTLNPKWLPTACLAVAACWTYYTLSGARGYILIPT